MTPSFKINDRRTALRFRSDDVLRWKRPGRIEDHKGWSIDRSVSGLGFATLRGVAPNVGDSIHLRILDRDRWQIIEGPVRVARINPTSDDSVVIVGCTVRTTETAPCD